MSQTTVEQITKEQEIKCKQFYQLMWSLQSWGTKHLEEAASRFICAQMPFSENVVFVETLLKKSILKKGIFFLDICKQICCLSLLFLRYLFFLCPILCFHWLLSTCVLSWLCNQFTPPDYIHMHCLIEYR